VKELTKLARDELQTTPAALALAWVAKQPNTSTVILGAAKPGQVLENLEAFKVIQRLTDEIMEKIEVLDNQLLPERTWGRPPLYRL